MARIFLLIVGGIVIFIIVALLVIAAFKDELAYLSMTPGDPFDAAAVPPAPDYAQPSAWAARPETRDAADQIPAASRARNNQADAEVDVFFIAPTTYYNRKSWNGAIDDADARERMDEFVLKYQASAFNGAGRIYAPLYRQATLGAFFPKNREDGDKALEVAYEDVRRAFRHYMDTDNKGRPFILAAHSQGSRHLVNLLRDEIDGTPLAQRMIAAYAVGFALPTDLFTRVYKTIQPCAAPTQTGCVVSWNSFSAQDSDPSSLFDNIGFQFDGAYESNTGKTLLCVNPLRWTQTGDVAPANENLGAIPTTDGAMSKPEAGVTGARCRDGVLYISPPQENGFSGLVLPGGNYHIYDYNLFYMNIRRNAEERTRAYLAAAS
ncbi:DUF3089 domain-containing protein [Iodidimonas sp. SYSU 1G8]|uniref:DUF3089 domain-containing protein n=1 Tax=Iodidimonas sp. SYSU 1G8 TaxID=3133967 RepID=UPI0031FE6D3A